ncbi:MAG: ATP-binding cassette domain-containing protein [Thermoplasmata archaeon]
MLKLDNFSIIYPHFSIKNFNLSVGRNEIIVLAGKNGSGKTTIIESMIGIRRKAKGKLYFENKMYEISALPVDVKKRIYLYSEDLPYFPDFSIIENLKYFAKLHDKKPDSKYFEMLMKKSGLTDYNKKYDSLSKGMKQRVSLLELMIITPEVVLMDEPTIGLDPAGKMDLISLISGIKDGSSDILGGVIATNDLDVIEKYATKTIFISEGNIILYGDFKTILKQLDEKYFVVDITKLDVLNLDKLNDLEGIIISGTRMLVPKKYEEAIKSKGYKIEEIEPADVFRVEDNGN